MSKEKTIDETIENAVINHDRLVEENKRLREALLDVVALQKKHYGDGINTHLAMTTKSRDIKQLLSELGEE